MRDFPRLARVPIRMKTSTRQSPVSLAALLLALAGFTGCNGADGGGNQQFVEPDWIHTGDTPTNDNTTVDPAPTATPTATATPSPTPTPTATSSPIPTSELYTGPEEVAPFVEKFVADALIQGVDVLPDMKNPKLTIQIKSLDAYGSSTIGLCETGGGLRRVTFDPDFWNAVDDTQKELLSHHELGHCVLYRGHDSSLLSTGKYDSIMYPIIMSSSTYLGNYDHYQEELYSTAK